MIYGDGGYDRYIGIDNINRIKPAFYAQFNSKPACRPDGKIDTVTGATISSHAIIEDVFLSSQTVMSLPEVNPLLRLMPVKSDK